MKPTNTQRSRRTVSAPPIWNPLIQEVALLHKIHPRDMLCGLKSDKAVGARHELWFRLHRDRNISLAEIGRRLGGFHHTTVMHGVRQWAERVVVNG